MKAQGDYAVFSHAKQGLRELERTESQASRNADTDWSKAIEILHPSRALLRENEPCAESYSWQQGPAALVFGVKSPTSFEARPASAPRLASAKDQDVAALKTRVQNLETLVAQLLAKQEQVDEEEADAPSDSHFQWIETHRDELRAYPDSYVLLDPRKGIVFHSTNGEAITARLAVLPRDEQDHLMVFHTSMAL